MEERRRVNLYGGKCNLCKQIVRDGDGEAVKTEAGWHVEHKLGDCPGVSRSMVMGRIEAIEERERRWQELQL